MYVPIEVNGRQYNEKKPLLYKNDTEKLKSNIRPLIASFIASILSFASGPVIAGWVPPNKTTNMGEMMFMVSEEQTSWIISIYLIGSLIGALLAGHISQVIGRKTSLLLIGIPMSLGWIIIYIYNNSDVNMIYLGRLLCGFSVGAITVAVPLYNQEIASDICRGRGGVFLDFMLCLGILYSYSISAFVGLPAFSLSCSVIPIIFAILFAFMPESPSFLYGKGLLNEAIAPLRWLKGDDCNIEEEFKILEKVKNQAILSKAQNTVTRDNNYNIRLVNRKALALSFALVCIQRASGAGAIIQYTGKLFLLSDSSVKPATASIITGIFQVIASGASILLIDKVGRRRLLMISSSAVIICLALLASYFYFLEAGLLVNTWLEIMPVIILCIHIFFFRLGLGPIPWFMGSELIGSEQNNFAQSSVAAFSWILFFFILKSFNPLVESFPVGVWIGFMIMSIIGFTVILLFIPETNNKSREEIKRALQKSVQCFS
ncbi:facilitated trehalose transporter Tret1-like isoform X2 [Daktulosphaira vitifoliae]|nr:facilitated trehalose transporter Tret1-like isoform X2 [Daktulosphaira vitifoliae]